VSCVSFIVTSSRQGVEPFRHQESGIRDQKGGVPDPSIAPRFDF
jgi:hypothetical protein